MSSSSYLDEYRGEAVPSYEESVGSPSRTVNGDLKKIESTLLPPLPLQTHLADTRTRRIRSILSAYVDPLLFSLGGSGLYKTIFILVPSNVTTLQSRSGSSYSEPKEPEVVGFAVNDVVKLVRLVGEEHTLEFWRQTAVMKELESSLKAQLVATGHRPEASPGTSVRQEISLPPEPKEVIQSPSAAKKSFWKRTTEKYIYKTADPEAVIIDRKLGWRADDEGNLNSEVPTGQVRVKVEWKEVCLRMETETGLYETKRGPGLCLTVEVGS